MKKKLVGLMFAATMLFGASMTVFAADVSDNDFSVSGNNVINKPGEGTDITMNSEVEKPVLEVTITAGARVIANPYGIENSTLGLTADETLKGTKIEFENKGNTAISVGLTGKITLASYADSVKKEDRVTIATSAPTTAKSKQVFIQAAITSDGTKALQTSAGKPEKALVYSGTGAKLTNAPVLAADPSFGAIDTKNSNKIVVTLSGATSQSPTSEWTDDDKFTVVTTYDLSFGDRTKLSTFGSGS